MRQSPTAISRLLGAMSDALQNEIVDLTWDDFQEQGLLNDATVKREIAKKEIASVPLSKIFYIRGSIGACLRDGTPIGETVRVLKGPLTADTSLPMFATIDAIEINGKYVRGRECC